MFILDAISFLITVSILFLPIYYVSIIYFIIEGEFNTKKEILMSLIPYWLTFKAMERKFNQLPWE